VADSGETVTTEHDAIEKAVAVMRRKVRRELPVHSAEYFSEEREIRAHQEFFLKAKAKGTYNPDRAKVEEFHSYFLEELRRKGSFWVVRFDRCPPPEVVIDPSAYIVRVYDRTGRAVPDTVM